MNKVPFVTFIIPTLNAGRDIKSCLESIEKQNYPKDMYEVLVVDGGSHDDTRKIAESFGSIVVDNPRIDQESGKAIGIKMAKGEVIALLDSDNEIVKEDWLKRMVFPLIDNPRLFGVESEYFPKKGENVFNTYSMLLHIADPFSRMLAAKLVKKPKKYYVEYLIPEGESYPLGANGFLWNKKVIDEIGLTQPMFEESNFSFYVMQKGFRSFARVSSYGIYHHHINSLGDFIKKRLKIGNKFLNRKREKKRTWLEGVSPQKFFCSLVYCVTFIGPLFEGIFNYRKTRNKAWLLHPFMSFLSVVIYATVFVQRKLKV